MANPNYPRSRVGSVWLLSFRLNDRPPHVITALRANNVLRSGLAALGAKRELLRVLGVVRPAFAGSRIRLSAFWNCHLGLDLRPTPLLPLPLGEGRGEGLGLGTYDKYRGADQP
jgi:hypothetical protein